MQIRFIVFISLFVTATVLAVMYFHGRGSSPAFTDQGMASPSQAKSTARPLSGSAVTGVASKVAKSPLGTKQSDAASEMINESKLIIDRTQVDVSSLTKVLGENSKFAELARSLSSNQETETIRRQQLYANAFQANELYLSGAVAIDDLACGKQICVAEISSQDPQKVAAFIENVTNSKDAPMYLVSDIPLPVAGRGKHVKRLMFSTDPALNGFSAPFAAR